MCDASAQACPACKKRLPPVAVAPVFAQPPVQQSAPQGYYPPNPQFMRPPAMQRRQSGLPAWAWVLIGFAILPVICFASCFGLVAGGAKRASEASVTSGSSGGNDSGLSQKEQEQADRLRMNIERVIHPSYPKAVLNGDLEIGDVATVVQVRDILVTGTFTWPAPGGEQTRAYELYFANGQDITRSYPYKFHTVRISGSSEIQ